VTNACKDCRFVNDDEDDPRFWRCRHWSVGAEVSCEEARASYGHTDIDFCGPEGIYWENRYETHEKLVQ